MNALRTEFSMRMATTTTWKLALAVCCFVLLGCSSDDADPVPPAATAEKPTMAFPDDFMWGTAIAGFQVEMGCPTIAAEDCEDRKSDWYEFITRDETVNSATTFIHGDPPSSGPGYWELYDEDHARAKDVLNNNALRLSIEWSRIFPTATDAATTHEELKALADDGAVQHYRAIFASLKARGLTPLVTLNHYTLPTWIHDGVGCHLDVANCSPRGWLDKDRTVKEMAKYAGFCAREFGAEVDGWVTLNEPFAVLMPGYLLPSAERTNPPAVFFNIEGAPIVMLGLIEAHARMYDAIHANDTVDADGDGEAAQVGVVYAMVPVVPKDAANPVDVKAAENVFYIYNMVYLNAVTKGMLDHDMDGTAELRDDLAGRMDYLGINYYTRLTVTGTETAIFPELSPLSTFDPLSLGIWETYPKGIYEMIKVASDELGMPVIITENGTDKVEDEAYSRDFLARILQWTHRAIAEGADVRGYFLWSLVDNYEWNHGFALRFGAFAVDIEDVQKPRTLRPFAEIYADIAGQNGLDDEQLKTYPISE